MDKHSTLKNIMTVFDKVILTACSIAILYGFAFALSITSSVPVANLPYLVFNTILILFFIKAVFLLIPAIENEAKPRTPIFETICDWVYKLLCCVSESTECFGAMICMFCALMWLFPQTMPDVRTNLFVSRLAAIISTLVINGLRLLFNEINTRHDTE